MKKLFTCLTVILSILGFFTSKVSAQRIDGALKNHLEAIYGQWRKAMTTKDYRLWTQYTAAHRQRALKNRILSEKKPFPAALFNIPVKPPQTKNLKILRAESKGNTAALVYFGKIDFGIGGKPSENILMLNFVHERGGWKYSDANFINLNLLKDVRKAIKSGDLTYIKQKDFGPSGIVPQMPIAVNGAQYIAKVYVYCPGREVRLKVNGVSNHRFQNTKASEVVIGGAHDNRNEIQFATKSLEGSTGKEALCIRVYLMSTVRGVKPIKIYEYLVNEKAPVKPYGTGYFNVDANTVKKLQGKVRQ